MVVWKQIFYVNIEVELKFISAEFSNFSALGRYDIMLAVGMEFIPYPVPINWDSGDKLFIISKIIHLEIIKKKIKTFTEVSSRCIQCTLGIQKT